MNRVKRNFEGEFSSLSAIERDMYRLLFHVSRRDIFLIEHIWPNGKISVSGSKVPTGSQKCDVASVQGILYTSPKFQSNRPCEFGGVTSAHLNWKASYALKKIVSVFESTATAPFSIRPFCILIVHVDSIEISNDWETRIGEQFASCLSNWCLFKDKNFDSGHRTENLTMTDLKIEWNRSWLSL